MRRLKIHGKWLKYMQKDECTHGHSFGSMDLFDGLHCFWMFFELDEGTAWNISTSCDRIHIGSRLQVKSVSSVKVTVNSNKIKSWTREWEAIEILPSSKSQGAVELTGPNEGSERGEVSMWKLIRLRTKTRCQYLNGSVYFACRKLIKFLFFSALFWGWKRLRENQLLFLYNWEMNYWKLRRIQILLWNCLFFFDSVFSLYFCREV